MSNKSKSKITTIALVLVLTLSFVLFTMPVVTAQPTKETYAFIMPIDDPIGVNQVALFWVGITDMVVYPQNGWANITVTVTDPEGNTDTLGPYRTDMTGTTGITYTPTIVGTYTFQAHFPEQVNEYEAPGAPWRTAPAGTVMLASDSEIETLTVQAEPLEYHPGFQLPNEYWTRPINAQFREWYTIAGSYLWDDFPATYRIGNAGPHSIFQPYNEDAPETAHILWRRQDVMGGLAGGVRGEHGFDDGTAYEGKWSGYIMGGILYLNVPWPMHSHYQGVRAIDLRTGEELWFKEGIRMKFGQLQYWSSRNMHAVFAYLWAINGTTWSAYDAYSGEWWFTLENVPTGSIVHGPNGEILVYTVNLEEGWMTLWNSSHIPELWGTSVWKPNDFYYFSWRPYGKTVDATGPVDEADQLYSFPLGKAGYMWNKTIPKGLPGVVKTVREGVMLGSNVRPWEVAADPVVYWAFSTEPGREGELLFNKAYHPTGNVSLEIRDASVEDGVFVAVEKETRRWHGYNLTTGEELWVTTKSQPITDWVGFAQVNWVDVIAYGKLYSGNYGGVMHAYDVKTGQLEWNYTAVDEYGETLMGPNWALGIYFITDGKIYLGHFEHSSFDPLPRGSPSICLDAETGDEIWKIDIRTGNFMGASLAALPIIGDSVMVIQNSYDMNDYAIAKGPSEITASVQNDVTTLGSSVMVKGTVMDVSPGTEEPDLKLRFPSGVPAVSDESMSDWMQYIYMQYSRPTNTIGVQVKLMAIDPNANHIDIGTVTTDSYGNYGFSFKPEDEGNYLIVATFEGSKSYYGSTTTAYLTVDPAAPAGGELEPEAQAPFMTTEIAMLIAVVVIAAIAIVAYWAFKRR